MALLEIKVDLNRVAKALERIADALEPQVRVREKTKPARFINVEPADIAEAEEEADRKRAAGTDEAT